MGIEQYVERLRELSAFGLKMTMHNKLTKHLHRKDVRKVRTYLVCLKLAFPEAKVSDTVDQDLINQVRELISPYYVPNPKWKAGMDEWSVFNKIKEPPQ